LCEEVGSFAQFIAAVFADTGASVTEFTDLSRRFGDNRIKTRFRRGMDMNHASDPPNPTTHDIVKKQVGV
jgi:hypothetical protein